MSNRNKENGDKAERDFVEWLRANGFPDACRARGEAVDFGDIGGIPGVCPQVKRAARQGYVMARLREAQAGALEQAVSREPHRRPVAVVRLPRVTDPADWWAATPVQRVGLGWDLPVDAREVGEGCFASTIARAIASDGGALRWSHGCEWWVTTVERLFSLLVPRVVR